LSAVTSISIGEGEQRQIGEKARPARIFRHIADGIEVHERRHRGDDDEHHHGQRVDTEGPVDHQVARCHPARQRHLERVLAKAHLNEGDPRQQRGQPQKARGDDLARPVSDARAKQARYRKAGQWEENDGLIQHGSDMGPSVGCANWRNRRPPRSGASRRPAFPAGQE
jgi:hypothetical protein